MFPFPHQHCHNVVSSGELIRFIISNHSLNLAWSQDPPQTRMIVQSFATGDCESLWNATSVVHYSPLTWSFSLFVLDLTVHVERVRCMIAGRTGFLPHVVIRKICRIQEAFESQTCGRVRHPLFNSWLSRIAWLWLSHVIKCQSQEFLPCVVLMSVHNCFTGSHGLQNKLFNLSALNSFMFGPLSLQTLVPVGIPGSLVPASCTVPGWDWLRKEEFWAGGCYPANAKPMYFSPLCFPSSQMGRILSAIWVNLTAPWKKSGRDCFTILIWHLSTG